MKNVTTRRPRRRLCLTGSARRHGFLHMFFLRLRRSTPPLTREEFEKSLLRLRAQAPAGSAGPAASPSRAVQGARENPRRAIKASIRRLLWPRPSRSWRMRGTATSMAARATELHARKECPRQDSNLCNRLRRPVLYPPELRGRPAGSDRLSADRRYSKSALHRGNASNAFRVLRRRSCE
jgi:hypothetical protein